MIYQLKISSQNQVTLPVDLLKQLGLSKGGYLRIKPDEEDFRILNTRAKIAKLGGFLKDKIKDKSKLGLSDEELEEAIERSKVIEFQNRTE
jgi:bifunctional DNA-binding transcriptional regulator/antitoxin component of YhaV-PrlF toxin-antitoxin module